MEIKIGHIIKQLRLENKLTQLELAKKLGLSQDTISLWELDKSLPDIVNLVKLSKIFDVKIDKLLNIA